MDPLHQGVAQFLQGSYFIQIVRTDGDIRDLSGNLCTVTDGDTYICCGQCGRIIDTISDHNDLMAGLLLLFYELCLVLRQYLGIIFIHTNDICDGLCNAVAVSRHHYDFADS